MTDRVEDNRERVFAIALLFALAAADGFARRRAVTPSPTPPLTATALSDARLTLPTSGDTSVAVTNHDNKSVVVTLCEVLANTQGKGYCRTTTLAPQGTLPLNPAVYFQHSDPGVIIATTSADPTLLELRNNALARTVDQLGGFATISTILGPDVTQSADLGLYTTTQAASGRIILQGRFGVPIETKTFSLPAFTFTQASLWGINGFFIAPPQPNTAIEVIVDNGNFVGSYLRMSGRAVPAQLKRDEQSQYLLPARATTLVRLKNESSTTTNGIFFEQLQSSTTPPRNMYFSTNDEVAWLPASTLFPNVDGVLALSCSPLLSMYVEDGIRLDEVAIAKSGSPSDTITPRDASINNIDSTTTLHVQNISRKPNFTNLVPITGTLAFYDTAGQQVGQQNVSITALNGADYSLAAYPGVAMAYLHLNKDPTEGLNINPQAIMYDKTRMASAFAFVPPGPKIEGSADVQLRLVMGNDGTTDTPSFTIYGPLVSYTFTLDNHGDLQPGRTVSYTFRVPAGFCYFTDFSIKKPGDDAWCIKEIHLSIDGSEVWFNTVADQYCPYTSTSNIGGGWAMTAMYKTRCAPPVFGTAGQYLGTWLDPLHQQYFFLSNRETRCMLRGDCGAASMRDQLATLYARGIGETWTPQQFVDWLNQSVDGITTTTNIELWANDDPFTWSAGVGVSYTLTKSQQTWTREPGTIRLTPPDTESAYQLIRAFLAALITAHPEWYGGTTAGPNINYDPTWTTHDRNDTSGLIPSYTSQAIIYVKDHGQTFIQTTYPSAETLQHVFNTNTLEPLVGFHSYACESLPDAIVNSVQEIVANYLRLTAAEQAEFSGDVQGFKPFIYYNYPDTTTIDPCNINDPDQQFAYRIDVTVTKATSVIYEMTATLGVWSNGQALQTSGTTTNTDLMKILTGTTNLDAYVGFNVYSNTNPNYQDLQTMAERIKAQFKLDSI